MATSDTFHYAYALAYRGTTGYRIDDASPNTNFVDYVAGGVKVKDPDGGDIFAGDKIKVAKIGADLGGLETGKYAFVGAATVQDHGDTISGIIILDSAGRSFFLTDTQYSGELNGPNGDVTITSGNTTICFMAGTLIGTPAGEVPVEILTRGDQVLTHDGGVATVDWLGIQTVSTRFADKMRVLPIRIKAGALAEGVPSRDLLISPDHAVLVDGALIQAGALVNGTSIIREHNVPTTFAYYHVEVEDHSLILAENTPAETFVDNIERLHFDNWAEHEALYPNGKSIRELPYPRAKSHRQVPVRTRVMLAARVQAIGASQTAAEVA
ncbi:Hint domain-containing protein [Bradyrhizobium sp. USDA 10063]